MIYFDIFNICGQSALKLTKKFDKIEAKNDRYKFTSTTA